MESSIPTILDNFSDSIDKMSEGLMVDQKYWENNSKLINFIRTQKTIDSFI